MKRQPRESVVTETKTLKPWKIEEHQDQVGQVGMTVELEYDQIQYDAEDYDRELLLVRVIENPENLTPAEQRECIWCDFGMDVEIITK